MTTKTVLIEVEVPEDMFVGIENIVRVVQHYPWRPVPPARAVGDERRKLNSIVSDIRTCWHSHQLALFEHNLTRLYDLLAAAPAANEHAPNRDVQTIAELILRGEQGDLGVICSGLAQDFLSGTNTFRVRYKDGSTFQVTVRSEEVDGDEEFFVEPKPANCASNGHIFGAQKGCIFCGAEKPVGPSAQQGGEGL